MILVSFKGCQLYFTLKAVNYWLLFSNTDNMFCELLRKYNKLIISHFLERKVIECGWEEDTGSLEVTQGFSELFSEETHNVYSTKYYALYQIKVNARVSM